MEKNLKDQIIGMQSKLFENGITINDFIKRLKETIFQRDYLYLNINEEKVKDAEKIISNHESLTSELLTIKENISKKQTYLSELKPPLLFGKAIYQERFNIMKNEILMLQQSLEEVQSKLYSMENSYKESVHFKNFVIEESRRSVNQYDKDEKLYNIEKKKIISTVADQISILPENIIHSGWEDIEKYFINFFHQSPNDNLFPVIGWKYAYEHALFLMQHYDDWRNSDKVLIINGKTKELKEEIDLFLRGYVFKIKDNNNPYFYIIKALVFFLIILDFEDGVNLVINKDKLKDDPRILLYLSVWVIDHPLGKDIQELFDALDKAEYLAIEQNNEKVLNDIIIIKKGYYLQFGWLKKYFKKKAY